MANTFNPTYILAIDITAEEIEMETRKLIAKRYPHTSDIPNHEIIFPKDLNIYPEITIRSIKDQNRIMSKAFLKELLETTYEEVRGRFLNDKITIDI